MLGPIPPASAESIAPYPEPVHRHRLRVLWAEAAPKNRPSQFSLEKMVLLKVRIEKCPLSPKLQPPHSSAQR